MMPLKRYNLAAVLLLLLGGYGSAQAAIAPDRTRLVFRGEDKSISVDLKTPTANCPIWRSPGWKMRRAPKSPRL